MLFQKLNIKIRVIKSKQSNQITDFLLHAYVPCFLSTNFEFNCEYLFSSLSY